MVKQQEDLRTKLKGVLEEQEKELKRVRKNPCASETTICRLIYPENYSFSEEFSDSDLFEIAKILISVDKEEELLDGDFPWSRILNSKEKFDFEQLFEDFSEQFLYLIFKHCSGAEIYANFFENCQLGRNQYKILDKISLDDLEAMIFFATGDSLYDLVDFISCSIVENVHNHPVLNAERLVSKLSNLGAAQIAKIFEHCDDTLINQIIRGLDVDKRMDVAEKISDDTIYVILQKTNFSFVLDYPSLELNELIYYKLSDMEKEGFYNVLKDYVDNGPIDSMFDLLNEEILADVLFRISEEADKAQYIQSLFLENSFERFSKIIEYFSPGESIEMYKYLLQSDEVKKRLLETLPRESAENSDTNEFIQKLIINYIKS